MVALISTTAANGSSRRLRLASARPDEGLAVGDDVMRVGVTRGVTAKRRGHRPPLRLVDSPPHETGFHGVPVAGMVAAVAVVFGLLAVVRLLQGAPPTTNWAELTPDPRVPAPALVGPGDHLLTAQPGDTLWSIATELTPSQDPRPTVDALAEANGGSSIAAGQELVIPADLVRGAPVEVAARLISPSPGG